jgi:hypothetical protein
MRFLGYLPAEHIETPTERLARLNKHRNIDVSFAAEIDIYLFSLANRLMKLSATMLGDQQDKSKTTFKSAIRGRRKKTVTFTAPTYVDYSDFDYSSEEEDLEELFAQQQAAVQQQQQQQQAAHQASADVDMADDTAKVEPLKPRGQKDTKTTDAKRDDSKDDSDSRPSSEEIFDSKPEGPSRSRNGTVRNTDSFFKDETVETKKITLTPNLLRDDNTPRASTESKELRSRPSLDKMEKELQPDKNGKDDKKKKEKDKKEKERKPSVIRNFFTRKDKKRTPEDDDESMGKRSMDIAAESQEIEDVVDDQNSPDRGNVPQRNPSKLQKQQPRTEPSPTRKGSMKSTTLELAAYLASEGRTNDISTVPPASMRLVEPEPQDPIDSSAQRPRDVSPSVSKSAATAPQKEERTGISKILSKSPSTDSRPQKVVKAKTRVELDDFDTTDEEVSPIEEPSRQQRSEEQQQLGSKQDKLQRPTLPGAYPDSYVSSQTPTPIAQQPIQQAVPQQQRIERLSESPVQVSPITATNPPALMIDTSSQEGHSSESPSPELIERDEVTAPRHLAQDVMARNSSSTGASTTASTWNDAKLRAFFDSSSDIRDLLVVVYDKSDVSPAGPDHPVAGTLFREQNAKLAEITTVSPNYTIHMDWFKSLAGYSNNL